MSLQLSGTNTATRVSTDISPQGGGIGTGVAIGIAGWLKAPTPREFESLFFINADVEDPAYLWGDDFLAATNLQSDAESASTGAIETGGYVSASRWRFVYMGIDGWPDIAEDRQWSFAGAARTVNSTLIATSESAYEVMGFGWTPLHGYARNVRVAYLTAWAGIEQNGALVSDAELAAMAGSGPLAGDGLPPWIAAPANAGRIIVAAQSFESGFGTDYGVNGWGTGIGSEYAFAADNPILAGSTRRRRRRRFGDPMLGRKSK